MIDDYTSFGEDPVYIERSLSAPPIAEHVSQATRQGFSVANVSL